MSPIKLAGFDNLSFPSPEFLPEGYVRLPWRSIFQETKISPGKLVIQDSIGNYIPAQVFQVDRDDPSHDFLIISLRDTPSRLEEVSRVIKSLSLKEGEVITQNRGFPRLEVILGPNSQARGVKLASGKLSIWFNLIPAPEDYENDWNWYSGSATSVLLNNQEMLEYFTNDYVSTTAQPYWMRHDPQKRCMQVDKIRVRDDIHTTWSEPYNLFDQPYELISHSIGSVGVSITIASTPFSYGTGSQYRLYRILSLFKDSDYLLERLFVRKTNIKPETIAKNDYLEFKAHYFTFMDLHFWPIPMEFSSHKGFAMVSCMPPYPAYGFMCNTEQNVNRPTEDFPEWPNKYKTFSWELSGCQSAECMHRLAFTFDNTLPELFSKENQWQALPW
ncbi:hypothetical protein [Nodosilinea sp. P-1105]|uniref:hypothetical protein n=1 Tax=Nodosilinea sp. P-1105 TaxID=2546229 RepID=UPI00146F6166|nr:hypothetical protein [Nodosilinea sp. P-1105]NMF85517.1 hypothetical protein [Nodosilinea sp. P-1105]